LRDYANISLFVGLLKAAFDNLYLAKTFTHKFQTFINVIFFVKC